MQTKEDFLCHFFLTYAADSEEYVLKPAGYGLLIVLLAALLFVIYKLGKASLKTRQMQTKQLVYCSAAMALAVVTSFIKVASLPFGGSITLFSMMFICLIGYIYGARTGLITGLAYGILQFIVEPYIYAPLQVLLDYPLAFAGLGLAGFFSSKKARPDYRLPRGYLRPLYLSCVIRLHILCRLCTGRHESVFHTLGYNATYIVPEAIAAVIVFSLPPVAKAIAQVKKQAISS